MSVTLRKRALLLSVLSLSILIGCSRETSNSVSGKVIKIVDGDTITILDSNDVQHKIRLQGIDAPERSQPFYDVSKEHLAALVFGKNVTATFNLAKKYDRWGRILGKVLIDGNDECLEQVKAGLAWHFKKYEKEQTPADRQLYANAEQEARTQKIGLWKDPRPTPPWDFRHPNGSTEESAAPDEPSLEDPGVKTASPSVEPGAKTPLSSIGHHSTTARTALIEPKTSVGDLNPVRGNRHSMIYHWPGCPDYDKIAFHNRLPFETREAAERAGYRAARNCN